MNAIHIELANLSAGPLDGQTTMMANDEHVPPADEADRKVWHAVNFIDECEEIVRLAAEIYATEPTENFRGDKVFPFFRDAARLWAKMQREVGDGA